MRGLGWSDLARAAGESPMWELFHESCRLGRKDRLAPASTGATALGHLANGLAYETYPAIELPAPAFPAPPEMSSSLPLTTLSALLAPAEGSSGEGKDTPGEGTDAVPARSRSLLLGAASPVRPLEIFLHASYVEDLDIGLYHYQFSAHRLHHLRRSDHSHKIASALPDPQSIRDASVMLLLAAVPERATARWGERGYRFTLLEVGAAARDLELRGRSLGLECRHFAEYRDRELDELLDCDGLCVSVVHLLALGRPANEAGSSLHHSYGGDHPPTGSPLPGQEGGQGNG